VQHKTIYPLVAAILLAACSDEPLSPNRPQREALVAPTASAHLAAAAAGRLSRGFEDEILRLENRIPGLGGLFRQDGDIVIYLQDPSQRGAAMRELRAAASTVRADPAFRSQLAAGNRVTVRTGKFPFSQLVAWQGALLRAVAGTPALLSVDADEARNQVHVHLVDGGSRAAVDAAIATLSLPPGAVHIDFGPRVDAAHLTSRFRPTGGGVQIQNGSGGSCTLGFNITTEFWNETGLLTASHCAEGAIGAGATGGTIFQNTAAGGNEIGTVHLNPAFNRTDAECGGMSSCTYADAMMVIYSSASLSQKRIARTAFVGQNYGAGSLDEVGWFTDISKAWFTPYVGMTADKVGRTTGWTRGTVNATCAAVQVNGPGGYMVLCADSYTGSRGGRGDSGSPVFYPPAGGDPAWAVGILFAVAGIPFGQNVCTTNCTLFYSPWNAIELNHISRYFNYTPPAPPPSWYVNIYGPDAMRPGNLCHWYAQHNIPEPANYQWSVDGNVVGNSQDLWYSASSNFTLDLQVWNNSGPGGGHQKSISVSNENGDCLDM
jgi:hypothetical protein